MTNPKHTSETSEELDRRTYTLAWKFKNTSIEEDVIYAKLEKQGIPKELAL